MAYKKRNQFYEDPCDDPPDSTARLLSKFSLAHGLPALSFERPPLFPRVPTGSK